LESSNRIAIGILGPEALVHKVLNVIATSFPSFQPISRACSVEQAPHAAEELLAEVEVLLITGPALYRRVKEQVVTPLPVHMIPLTDTGLFSALYRLRSKPQLHAAQTVFSIDSFTSSALSRHVKEIGEDPSSFLMYDGAPYPQADALTQFHVEAFRNGAAQAAMTTESEVADELGKRGIPCEWITPTDQNITVALERALLSTETRRSKEAQILVGMLNVDDFGKKLQQQSSEHDVQRFKLEVHRKLIDYVESLDGYLTHLGADEYLFFTTRGIFERETVGYKSVPLAREVWKSLGLSLSMGIGFGRSANEAGTHARLALRRCKEAGGNTCFIVREDKTLIGPLEMADPLSRDLSVTDPVLLKNAEDAGMTSTYLSRLLATVARTSKLDYEVHELANILGVTVRSTHRLLLQWTDHGLISISGYVKVPKGRPKQTFRLQFLEKFAANPTLS
jgi:AraC-like DNA-binding protein